MFAHICADWRTCPTGLWRQKGRKAIGSEGTLVHCLIYNLTTVSWASCEYQPLRNWVGGCEYRACKSQKSHYKCAFRCRNQIIDNGRIVLFAGIPRKQPLRHFSTLLFNTSHYLRYVRYVGRKQIATVVLQRLFSASYYLRSPSTASGAHYRRSACIDMDVLRRVAVACCDMGWISA